MLRRTPAALFALLAACTTAASPTDTAHGPSGKADDATTGACPADVVHLIQQCVTERVGEIGTEPALKSTVDACAGEESVAGLLRHVCAADSSLCPSGDELSVFIADRVVPCREAATPMAKVTLHLEDWNAAETDPYYDGWVFDDGQPYFEETIVAAALPFRRRIAGFDAKISTAGVVSLDYNWGDADVDISSDITLPNEDGVLSAAPGVYELHLYGGDNASGAWGVSGTMSFELAR